MIPSDLPALAEAVARWVDDVDDVPAVYLFGSRVRGDHRPDSDVDLCLFLDEWGGGCSGTEWWIHQNETDYADLKAALPGRLELHRDQPSEGHRGVDEARADPARIVLQVRKAVCLWTPPKPARPLRARPAVSPRPLTPADYLAAIVIPTLHELTTDPSDRRRAYLACIVAAHLVDHIARAGGGSKTDVQTAVRAQGAFAEECLDLVQAVCNGTKHAYPDSRAAVQFAPGWERAFEANSLGGVLAARRDRRWERPGLGVERDDAERLIDESVEGLIAAAVMAFPGLFPDIDPLSVAPWLQPGDGAAPTRE